jgi:hypothetical protein
MLYVARSEIVASEALLGVNLGRASLVFIVDPHIWRSAAIRLADMGSSAP